MEQGNPQTIASFTGTLLKRERAADNRLVQLVFREGRENVLCVSDNPADAAWPIGETYRIQGVYKQTGKRSFIAQPTIASLKQRRKLKLSFNKILIIAVVLTFGGSAYGLVSLLRPAHSGQALGASTNASASGNSSTNTTPVTSTNQSTATPSTSSVSQTTTTSPTTQKTTTPAKTTTAAPAATTQAPTAPSTTQAAPPATPSTDTNPPAGTSTTTPTDPGATSPGVIDPEAASTTAP